ncbi:MAG: maltose acetyltransferase domain-containing protein [Acutalibacter sp.]
MVKEEERIFQGIVFCPGDPELVALKLRTHNLNVDYNNTYEDEYEKRAAILGEILGEMGEGTRIQGPIAFHYGKHTKIGRNFFGNFNLTIQDDGEVTIGDRCNFGPNVTIVTPIHPMVPEERNALLGPDGKPKRLCYAKPVHIGSDVWLGANVVVCPGVTIGTAASSARGPWSPGTSRPVPLQRATPAGSSGKSPNRTAWPTSRRFWRISPCPKASRACTDTQKRLPRRGPFYVRFF